METKHFSVTSGLLENKPLSLRSALRKALNIPLKKGKLGVSNGACFVNGKLERFSSRDLVLGDQVSFNLARLSQPKEWKKIFFDSFFSAWEKPIFSACGPDCTLHRLDKDTSGILLQSEREEFFALFREQKIKKTYFAIVRGEVSKDSWTMITHQSVRCQYDGQKIYQISKQGEKAETSYIKLGTKNGLTLLKCFPKTGKTHQIRVQLSSLGFPVMGDYHYGDKVFDADRMFLHAYALEFKHPFTQENTVLQVKVPEAFLRIFDENLYC